MKVKNVFLYVLIGFSSFVNAQGDPMRGPLNQPSNGVIDGVVLNEELPVGVVKPYEFVRSSDYVFRKGFILELMLVRKLTNLFFCLSILSMVKKVKHLLTIQQMQKMLIIHRGAEIKVIGLYGRLFCVTYF